MFAIIEDPDWARELLAHIAEREADVSSIL
jgi:hypothetical protein